MTTPPRALDHASASTIRARDTAHGSAVDHWIPTPILRLPPELQVHCFGAADLKDLATILRVCRLWHNVCVSTPAVWACQSVVNGRALAVVLARSGAVPLELEVGLFSAKGNFQDAVTMLEPHAHRLRSLRLYRLASESLCRGLNTTYVPHAQVTNLLGFVFPQLVSLDVTLALTNLAHPMLRTPLRVPSGWGPHFVPNLRYLASDVLLQFGSPFDPLPYLRELKAGSFVVDGNELDLTETMPAIARLTLGTSRNLILRNAPASLVHLDVRRAHGAANEFFFDMRGVLDGTPGPQVRTAHFLAPSSVVPAFATILEEEEPWVMRFERPQRGEEELQIVRNDDVTRIEWKCPEWVNVRDAEWTARRAITQWAQLVTRQQDILAGLAALELDSQTLSLMLHIPTAAVVLPALAKLTVAISCLTTGVSNWDGETLYAWPEGRNPETGAPPSDSRATTPTMNAATKLLLPALTALRVTLKADGPPADAAAHIIAVDLPRVLRSDCVQLGKLADVAIAVPQKLLAVATRDGVDLCALYGAIAQRVTVEVEN